MIVSMVVSPSLVATTGAVPGKEHADEAVEDFSVIQNSWHPSFRRTRATRDPDHIPSRWGLTFLFSTSIAIFNRKDFAFSTGSIKQRKEQVMNRIISSLTT